MESRLTAKITEHFFSLQGEGPFIGYPAFFIRFAGCVPPFCDFCDTKFSWPEDGAEIAVSELVKMACVATRHLAKPLVVVTGGEPCKQLDALRALCELLIIRGMQVQVETSGKVPFPETLSDCSIIWVCSPKYNEEKRQFLVCPDALLSNYFKFVVASPEDVSRVCDFIRTRHINKNDCYLMPQGATREEQQALMPQVVEWCKNTGLLFSARLHVLIWDKKRGV